MSTPSTTEQAAVTIPGARIAPDAYARADARAAEAMPGNIHPLGPTPGQQLGKVWVELIEDRGLGERMGHRARELSERNRGATARSLTRIAALLETQGHAS